MQLGFHNLTESGAGQFTDKDEVMWNLIAGQFPEEKEPAFTVFYRFSVSPYSRKHPCYKRSTRPSPERLRGLCNQLILFDF